MRALIIIILLLFVTGTCYSDSIKRNVPKLTADKVFFEQKQNSHLDSVELKTLNKIESNTDAPKLFNLNLLDLSIVLSILVPVVLILWFIFNRKQVLSNSYYQEISGEYAGFTETRYPNIEKEREGKIYSGIIMNILDVDANGYFRGDFRYGERLHRTGLGLIKTEPLTEGIFTFLGNLNHEFSLPIKRHPYKPSKNRIYLGKLYVVHRLDFLYEQHKFEDYVQFEYDIIHYREMKTLKFTICEKHNDSNLTLPKSFSLDRHIGLAFGPTGSVEFTVFE